MNCALSPALDGAKVVVNYVNDAKAAEEVVTKIAQDGKGSGFPVKADISTAAGRQFLVDETVKKWEKIDIL
jgi:3-oxoacyl-[acyl-carrier protein] reductase